ncbi:MAG: hypothetical protein HWQ38_24000 [Nostoc sp. NMS7]|uniref:DUF7210 family protein n=1 Tax=Nostoc sp. NMS7 TaxID=2815391 RepID=UPI0025CE4D72|nr:hypothetical protein [Nostoc sp. NMS7]MBN3949356.1 hypothetical protein [Nostoc sp. NMS7]
MALPTATYEAIERINHNNQPYEIGDTLELDERQAKELLELGAVKRATIILTPIKTKE